MIEPSQLYLFMGAALVLLITPGPAVLYITARSASQGRLAGLVSVLAIETANFLQAAAAALGLSAILLSSALAFDVVEYLGAAYLVYIGIRKLLDSGNGSGDETVTQESLSRIYWQGFAVNILNPKTALFFLAFLPQFVDPTKGNVIGQNLLLGAVFVGMVYNFLPFMVLPIYSVLVKMDQGHIDAANDLGADPKQTFVKVVLPLSFPGIVSGIIMVFMPALSTFIISDLLGGGQTMLLGNLIQNQFLSARNWQFGSAISSVMIVMVLIITLVSSKYRSEGSEMLW